VWFTLRSPRLSAKNIRRKDAEAQRGREVCVIELQNNQTELALPSGLNGVYYYHLSTAKETLVDGKVLVQ
jgi:hypothetical protein